MTIENSVELPKLDLVNHMAKVGDGIDKPASGPNNVLGLKSVDKCTC